jgi:hypothetical protein
MRPLPKSARKLNSLALYHVQQGLQLSLHNMLRDKQVPPSKSPQHSGTSSSKQADMIFFAIFFSSLI